MKDIQENKKTFLQRAVPVIVFVSGIGAAVGYGIWQKLPDGELLRNVVVMVFAYFALGTGMVISIDKGTLYYDNSRHLGRFTAVYLIGLGMAAAALYLPAKIWPVIVLAVALSLTSNAVIGMSAYVTLVLMIALLTDGPPYIFYMNVIVGLIAITLFQNIDYEFRFAGPLCASCIALFVCENAFYLLFENTRPSLDQYVLPLFNVFISCFLLLFLLKYYSRKIVHVYRDKYQLINDPEFTLLAQLKKENPKAYYHAVHTAYFCDKIALRIGANQYLCKALGYYSQMQAFRQLAGEKEQKDFVTYYHFPPDLCEALLQLDDPAVPLTKKEAAVAYFADAVVSSIRFFFEKDNGAVLDYKQVIPLIFKRKMDSGVLRECDITVKELEDMKELFVEENLYYDFLR
ncbi:MAG: hypothetical protein IJ711_12045 [Lachnospiraceae bacterium]|nr:hypothetical protein [Lachnospiraceae bacterium]